MVRMLKEGSSIHKELYSDLLDYAEKHRMTSRWTESNVKKYLDRLKKMYDVNDSTFQSTLKKVNADYKKKNKVKSDPYSDSSYKKESLTKESANTPRFEYGSVADVALDVLEKIQRACDLLEDTEGFTETDSEYIHRAFDLLEIAYRDQKDLCDELENYA